eukprot:TRINITY_DN11446_c0_g1_i1.p1 TRINITY_DN11446_c0_g1~~TRINITY_DN11446_c0_g1_i1.p1  ORF type:complete len:343 (-),score=60.29 TRINITY_DN11446_c0_g1_i1:62-1090(-)
MLSQLPDNLSDRHTRVHINVDKAIHTTTHHHHAVYASLGIDNSFNWEEFKKNFKIKILKKDEHDMVVELSGIDAPIANAFRRIMIADVPTVAIESVYFETNTSIIQDEILAHRLGMIPILVDPKCFNFPVPGKEERDEADSIRFDLKVQCSMKPGASANDPEHLKYNKSRVYSSDLEWIPVGSQSETFVVPPRPVEDDILIAKLRPGQEIIASLYCCKSKGRDHAKFSPVATAWYRLRPEIVLNHVEGKLAKQLVQMCPMKVFDIEDSGKAFVANPLNCTMCRECIRHPGWSDRVKLRRVKNSYIFTIESTGIIPPEVIFSDAMDIFLNNLEELCPETTVSP